MGGGGGEGHMPPILNRVKVTVTFNFLIKCSL